MNVSCFLCGSVRVAQLVLFGSAQVYRFTLLSCFGAPGTEMTIWNLSFHS